MLHFVANYAKSGKVAAKLAIQRFASTVLMAIISSLIKLALFATQHYLHAYCVQIHPFALSVSITHI
jgi:hypothetical protein